MDAVIKTENTVILSEKDVKIVQHLSNGLRATSIGKKLKLSNRTVEAYIEKLKTKFNAKSQAQLVAIFIRQNIIH